MELNTLFISYPSEDMAIAGQVNNAIKALPGNKFDVFLDRNYIKGGQRITNTIEEGLTNTLYFVAIATEVTRNNFDWCGEELGYYRGVHKDKERFETCLYHASIPDLFKDLRCFKAQSTKPEHRMEFGQNIYNVPQTDFYALFKNIAKLHNDIHKADDEQDYWTKVEKWANEWTDNLTQAYFDSLQTRVKDEWYPQGKLEINVSRGDFFRDKVPAIPSDAEVTMAGSMYNIFGVGAPGVPRAESWTEFTQFVIDATGSDTFCKILEDIIISALPRKADAKNDYVFQAPNQRFYRVILVKHSVYGNKRRDFIINTIETLDKVQSGDSKTTGIVAGINLGSKFRSIFIEKGSKYSPSNLIPLSLEDLVLHIKQMLHDIDRINADSASDGLADRDALIKLLDETEEVKDLFDKWYKFFTPMEQAAKQFVEAPNEDKKGVLLEAIVNFVEMAKRNNSRFLILCMKAYEKTLGA